MKRTYETLDAILVVGCMVILGGIAASLVFLTIPDNQLAILSSIAAGLLGTIVGGYAGFRWGASVAKETQRVQVMNDPNHAVPVEEK